MTDVTLPELLAERFPPLERYCPILPTVSPQQALFLLDDCREALYGGAVGGGKSAALPMGALQYVDRPGYRALLLRRTFAELSKGDALIPLSQEWLGRTDARWNEARRTWTFPSGATVEFGHVKDETSKHDYQGAAYQFVGFDELTHFTESIYAYIGFSRQRRRVTVPVPVRTRATANPGGVGHMWVRKRFIDERAADVLFVPAKVADNPGLDVADYAASLAHLPDELRRQLMDGDWSAFEGRALPDFGEVNFVEEFPLTDAHDRFEAADYGLNGTAWALIAVDFEGNLVFHDLLYVDDLIPSAVSGLVIAKRKGGWGVSNCAWADPSVWHRTGTRDKWGRPAMLADEFTDHGVPLIPANNDPRAGLIRLRELTKPDPGRRFPGWHPRHGEHGAPRLFVVANRCAPLVEQLLSAPLQPIDKTDAGEKIDPEWEGRHGHCSAMARYAVMTRPAPSEEPPEEADYYEAADQLRREALARHEQRLESGERRWEDLQRV